MANITKRTMIAASLALAASMPASASAQSQPASPEAQVKDDMHAYFRGEKGEGPFFFGAGLAGMGAGTVMVVKGGDITRGAGFPLIGLGLVQAIVGSTLLLGTNKRVAKLDAALDKDPVAWKRDEMKRMNGVQNSFIALMIAESALIVGGTITAVVTARKGCCKTLEGVGLGIAAESAITLTLDLFAAARAQDYVDNLRRFEPSKSASSSKGPGGSAPMSFGPISIGGRF